MEKKIIPVLCLATFTSVLGQGLVVPLLPIYARSLGASGFLIGLIFGIFSIFRSLCLPIFGKLSDQKGRKTFILLGLSCYFLASIAFLIFHGIAALLVIRLFQGIASAMIVPVVQAYAAEITPRGREGRMMSIISLSLYFGLSAGPIFGGAIKDMFSINGSFVAMGIVCAIGFLLSLLLLPPVAEEKSKARNKQPRSFKNLVNNQEIVGIFIVRFGYMLCVGSLWSFLPLIADAKFGMSSTTIGILISLIVFSSAVLSYPIGVISDKFNKRVPVFVGGAIVLSGIFLLYHSRTSHDLFIVVVLFGAGGALLTTSSDAMSAVIGNKMAAPGSVMSLVMAGHSAGMFSGPLLSGIVLDYSGNVYAAFAIAGVVFAVILAAAFFLTKGYYLFEADSWEAREKTI